ncbi:MAG: bacteriorhodopsin-like [Bacteroidota bacterium]
MFDLPSLTAGQYSLAFNMFSFTIASMLATFVFLLVAQGRVAPKYRISLIVSALVVGIAAYHYIRILGSWQGAYMLDQATEMYNASGKPFNDAYRYVDWLLTVPLLVVELVLVLALPKEKSGSLITRLSIAAVFMIGLGYPGEIAPDDANGTRALWGFLSSVPFAYILYVLWSELGSAMDRQSARVQKLFSNIRLLLLATWGFYPIVYMAPFLGISGAGAEIAIQVGYSIADVAAKAGYGLMIYAIARAKSDDEGYVVGETMVAQRAAA